jgi:hypothetical protein
MTLAEYVLKHTTQGECKCGRCIDVGTTPDPTGPHTVDLVLFKVAAVNAPSADDFRNLTYLHSGYYVECDPLDGKEHGYIELGGWIGDQTVALRYMALGVSLGVFRLLSPKTIMPGLAAELHMKMAIAGYVTVQRI